ncbi:MAG: B12-binding domain-containing radical SAM protein [Clostridiales bacterium]|nr:B12-binding domain-containing radical SAM protein [Clostridiales bacterium]
MKILLIYNDDSSIARFGKSRKEFPPLGLLFLGAVCESEGIDVELLNICENDVESIPYHCVIGLSINSSYNYSAFYDNIEIIRNKCDFLIVGGQHATVFPKETFIELMADYLIIGEGEYSLPKIISACYEGIKPSGDNIISKNDMNKAFSEKMRINDLDDLPFPARHLMDDGDVLLDKRIYGEDIKSISIITSRGCPHNCEFCANVYKGFRYRSAENVELEIIQLLQDYPEMKGLVFLDENLLFSDKHMQLLCERIEKHNLKWTCNARVDYFNRSIVRRMKESGCVEIKYGVESGSQRILDKMHKGITISQISDALINTYNTGIRTKCFLMFGFPGDNLESAKETIDFISAHEKFISRINLFSFSPLPNSPIFKKFKNIFVDNTWSKYRLYKQNFHWWGTNSEYEEMLVGYKQLEDFISERYGEHGTSVGS